MLIDLVYRPATAFDRLKETSALRLAIVLLVLRWTVTPIVTVANMYDRSSPMLLPPPFGIPEDTYRFYEIFWFGPFGVLLMIGIAQALAVLCRRISGDARISFRKSFEIVSLSFFLPWLPSTLGDYILIATVNARPTYLVPVHLVLLLWTCILVSIGFRRVFDLPVARCASLGGLAGLLFIVIGGLLIR